MMEDVGEIEVCAELNRDAIVPVEVTFSNTDITAEGKQMFYYDSKLVVILGVQLLCCAVDLDYTVVSSQAVIAPRTRSGCARYNILTDIVVEDDETFTSTITTASDGAIVGPSPTTTVIIEDASKYNIFS